MTYRSVFSRENHRIVATGKVGLTQHQEMLFLLDEVDQGSNDELLLDFGPCTGAYTNGMLPLLCTIDKLRLQGSRVSLALPTDEQVSRLFVNSNWAHFLDPERFAPSKVSAEKHLSTQRFATGAQQKAAVDGLLEVILRSALIPRQHLKALEWSLNEVTDNVLNHAEASLGGYVQAIAYKDRVSFTVADGGIGILNSLRGGYPDLVNDEAALEMAVQFGVTRGPEYGAGNGLAGTLALAVASSGSFEIRSGRGILRSYVEDNTVRSEKKTIGRNVAFKGTVANATIFQSASEKMVEALNLTANRGGEWDYLDAEYTTDDEASFRVVVARESFGVGSRSAGKQLRNKIVNLLNADGTKQVVVDWTGVGIVASSFSDEAIGRLFVLVGREAFEQRMRMVGMNGLVESLLFKALRERSLAR